MKFQKRKTIMGAMAGIALVASCQGNPNAEALTPNDLIILPKQNYVASVLEQANPSKMVKSVEEVANKEMEESKKELIDIHGYIYRLREGEMDLLKKVVYAESGGSTTEEQLATAETILNRVAYKKNSLTEVVFEKGQFSCAKNGEIYTGMGETLRLMTTDRIPETTSQIVEYAVYGGDDITETRLMAGAIQKGLDPEIYARGGALFFYEASGCSEKELEARKDIEEEELIGTMRYYRNWY